MIRADSISHTMLLADGVWTCPICGRSFALTFAPYTKRILCEGSDLDAAHTGAIGPALSMGAADDGWADRIDRALGMRS